MHSVRVPTNVRCYSNIDIIIRRSEVTLRARNDRVRCKKSRGDFGGAGQACSSLSKVLASFRSSVSKPSVNQS